LLLLCHLAVWIYGSDEDGLVLAHARVHKEQRGVVERDGGRRVPVGVGQLCGEEVHKGLPDLIARQVWVRRHRDGADLGIAAKEGILRGGKC
jgi:hypothetical protein